MIEGGSKTYRSSDILFKRGRRLEYLTVGWNLFEGMVAAASGITARSSSLLGFGIDSLIECFSGLAVLWRLRDYRDNEKRERRTLRLVGVSLLLLALYVAWESGRALFSHVPPEASLVGICLAIASLIMMPILAAAKRRVAIEMESRALQADSRQTEFCAILSLILLTGLSLNLIWGWWWADPLAGLGMTPLIAREGFDAIGAALCSCDDQSGR